MAAYLERTPLLFSLLRSTTLPARGGPSEFGIIRIVFSSLPISSFALNMTYLGMIGIRRRAISRERATGRRRGMR